LGLTFGELVEAANAKRSEQWDHTAHILALIYNTNAGKNARKLTARDIHPFASRKSKGSNYTGDKVALEHDALASEKTVQILPAINPDQVFE